MVAEILSIIAPLFLIAALGYFWARLGKPFDSGMVTQLTVLVTTPALVIYTFLKAEISLAAFSTMVFASLLLYALVGLAAALFLLVMRWQHRHYLPALMFGNAGNMGLPLCLFTFGEGGLALAITFFAVSSILNFTVGVSIAAGTLSPRQMVRMPILYAVALSVVILTTGLSLPGWLAESLRLLGGISIPLMIMALGVSLARLKIANLGRAMVLAVARIGIGMCMGFAVAALLGLEGPARGVLILQASMPAAVFNFLFAERYSAAGPQVAGVVLVSSLLSVATTPLLLWVILPV